MFFGGRVYKLSLPPKQKVALKAIITLTIWILTCHKQNNENSNKNVFFFLDFKLFLFLFFCFFFFAFFFSSLFSYMLFSNKHGIKALSL
jgi:hypothetical protein